MHRVKLTYDDRQVVLVSEAKGPVVGSLETAVAELLKEIPNDILHEFEEDWFDDIVGKFCRTYGYQELVPTDEVDCADLRQQEIARRYKQ